MKAEREWKSIRDLVDLYKNKMLVANPEYQRGIVWNSKQKKKLIDSVLRGYPLPLIYLHYIKKTVAGMQREDFEIIDGQQRITALYEFVEGSFLLFDPIKDDDEAKFPAFLKNQPCLWGRKNFSNLPPDLQQNLLDTELSLAKIETDDANDVRDLFVRLQSGLPLNAQEARDAWPGQFTDFILLLGGKPEIPRYPGHHFFQGPMGLNPRKDRGKTRQFAAQIAMLFFLRHERGNDYFPDINAAAINDFYFGHVDFDRTSAEAKRLVEILDILDRLLGDGKRPKLKAHDAIHLVLLVDSLRDDYTRSWEGKLTGALDKFMEGFASAKADKDSPNPDEFWIKYGQWTRVNSDRGDTIARRHHFYVEKMFEYLAPLQFRDPKRLFGELEREILFFKNHKICARCGAEVPWNEAEVHHVVEHSKGGITNLSNAALVHSACHPKGEAATKEFADQFFASQSTRKRDQKKILDQETKGYLWKSREARLFLPNGTDIRMPYKGTDYLAKVEGDQLIYKGTPHTPARLVNVITGTSRNAWRDLWIKFPDDDGWALADELRSDAPTIEQL
jgi:hypothetical protein